MTIRRYILTLGALLLALGLSACAGQPRSSGSGQPAAPTVTAGSEAILQTSKPEAADGRPQTLEALAESLRASGANVSEAGQVTQPFMSQPSSVLRVNGEDVQVFAYTDEAVAQVDAEALANVLAGRGTMMISWVAPPHGYHAGRLVALYVGSDADTLRLLEDMLGPPLETS
jgi:hypothetical protein